MSGRAKSEPKEDIVSDEMAIMKRSQPSVEIKQDAKGIISFTVKVYHDDPLAAAKKACEVIEELQKETGE